MGRPKRSEDVGCRCLTCGATWTRPAWQVTGRLYCSKACYDQSRRGKLRPARRIEPVAVRCGACSVDFLTGGRGRPRYGARYCSRACQGAGQSTKPDLRQMTGEEIAWMAGLFDGEGSVAFPRRGLHHNIRLSIASTTFDLLDRILVVTGTGAIVGIREHKNPLHSRSASWAVSGDRARELLALMRPWLIAKAHNADIALRAIEAWRVGEKTTEQPRYPRLEALAKQEM